MIDTNELEELLEAGRETQSLDFKASCAWQVRCFAKDILAFSNLSDGGYVVIGMKENNDGSYTREGINKEDFETYNIEIMRDQMSAFADPHVEFTVHFPKDKKGIPFVVIRIYPFEEIPVICRKDSKDTKLGTLYYRNRNRRVESAPISNSNDMNAVIRRAAQKLMQKLSEEGFSTIPSESVDDILDKEINGL